MNVAIGIDLQATKDVIENAPASWERIADSLSPVALQEVTRELEYIAQFAARAAGYFHDRDLGRSHKQSVVRSNNAIAAIRRSLKFTYPRNDLSF